MIYHEGAYRWFTNGRCRPLVFRQLLVLNFVLAVSFVAKSFLRRVE